MLVLQPVEIEMTVGQQTHQTQASAGSTGHLVPYVGATNGVNLSSRSLTASSLSTTRINFPDGTWMTTAPAGGTGGGIPYVGATANINFGNYSLTAGSVSSGDGITAGSKMYFKPIATPASVCAGDVWYDSGDNSLTVASEISGVKLQVGQESWIRVWNNTGDTILNGRAVYITGAAGNRPTVAYASTANSRSARVVGVVTENIPINTFGYVTTQGLVNDIDTSSYTEGRPLFLCGVNGEVQLVPLPSPAYSTFVGVCITKNPTQGKIFVFPVIPVAFFELPDVKDSLSSTDNAIPVYDKSISSWIASNDRGVALKSGGLTSNAITANSISTLSDIISITGDSIFQKDINRYGFLNQTDTTFTFDGIKTFTLSGTNAIPNWSYYRSGIKHTANGNKTVSLSTSTSAAKGFYYIYIDSADGTLITSFSPWTLQDTLVPVATIAYDPALSPNHFIGDERHSCLIDRRMHWFNHSTEGTRLVQSPTLSGYNINSSVSADKTFAIPPAIIADEDIIKTIDELTDPDGLTQSYIALYRDTASTWKWKRSKMPFVYGTTGTGLIIEYNNGSGMSEATEGGGALQRYINSYLALTTISGEGRHIILPGRDQYTSLGAAQGENPLTADYAGFPSNESIIIYQLTWRTNNYTGDGKVQLAALPKAVSNTITNISTIGTGTHNALAGLQGGAIGEYYHLTQAEYSSVTLSAVPYVGATQNVNLGAYSLSAISISSISGYSLSSTIGYAQNVYPDSTDKLTIFNGRMSIKADNAYAGFSIYHSKTTNAQSSYLALASTRGSLSAPTKTLNEDSLGHIAFQGYDGANFRGSARIEVWSTSAFTQGISYPSMMAFYAGTSSETALRKVMTLWPYGLSIGSTSNPGCSLNATGGINAASYTAQGNYSISSTFLSNPSVITAVVSDNDEPAASWTKAAAGTWYHAYHVYAYRLLNGVRYYSLSYIGATGSSTDVGTEAGTELSFSWNPVTNADGYRILKATNDPATSTWNFDHYIDNPGNSTTGLYDITIGSWTVGDTNPTIEFVPNQYDKAVVTPNSIYFDSYSATDNSTRISNNSISSSSLSTTTIRFADNSTMTTAPGATLTGGLVPYRGATSAVNLGTNTLSAGSTTATSISSSAITAKNGSFTVSLSGTSFSSQNISVFTTADYVGLSITAMSTAAPAIRMLTKSAVANNRNWAITLNDNTSGEFLLSNSTSNSKDPTGLIGPTLDRTFFLQCLPITQQFKIYAHTITRSVSAGTISGSSISAGAFTANNSWIQNTSAISANIQSLTSNRGEFSTFVSSPEVYVTTKMRAANYYSSDDTLATSDSFQFEAADTTMHTLTFKDGLFISHTAV